jgi:hypothetical protein
MRVFLSYASEQRDLATRLALALRGMGINVFFDRDALHGGDAFDLRIRKAILRCHSFIFLASRQSLQAGAYPLSELGVAERRWPNPRGKLLPVSVDDTPIETLPAYLRAVSVLEPKGDIVPEVLDAVARLKRQRLRILTLWSAAVSIAIALISGALLWISPMKTPRNEDPFGPDGSMNSHVYTLKNGNQVRMVGRIVKNDSNIHDAIVRDEVENDAWEYNRCYDGSFGHLSAGMPQGTVIITFEVLDQLPQHARIDQSDFSDDGFNKCVLGILRGQTFNKAGPKGTGQVSYAFRFLPK